MTWAKKPAHGEVIASGVISSEEYYVIDVTDYVASRNSLYIGIYCTDPGLAEWIYIDSKESIIIAWKKKLFAYNKLSNFSLKYA